MTNILSKAKKSISRKASQAVAAAESLVIGKPPGRTSSGSSRGGRTSGKGSSLKAKDLDDMPPERVRIFCSDLYTPEFVTDALKSVEQDKYVCSIELEDLIQRNETDITKAVVDLLVDNAMASTRKKPAGRHSTKRIWTEIVLVDCISDANSYKEYLNLKSVFNSNLKRRLALKGVGEDLPIRFEAKIELHTMLDVTGVIQLLQAIERDASIKQVRFNGYRGKEKDIPDMFASMADPETMEWKQTTEISLRFRRSAKDYKGQPNPHTSLVTQCSQALESVVFGSSMVGGSMALLGSSEESEMEGWARNSNTSKPRPSFSKDELATEVSLFDSESDLNVIKLGK